MEVVNLFTGASGLNTKVDPVRVSFNPSAGVSDLSVAVNVRVDNSGRVELRSGWDLKDAGSFHSLFCDGGDCFCIEEDTDWAAIMQIGTDLIAVGVRAYLTKGKHMAFVQINEQTFYCNGIQNGVLEKGISSAWPVGTYNGPDTNRIFETKIPIGTDLVFHKGRIGIVKGKAIFFSEEYGYGLFNLKNYWAVSSDIRMVASVDAGLFLSDYNKTYFLRGDAPHNFTQQTVANYPAHRYSVAHDKIEVSEYGFNESGLGVVWSSPEGMCVGLPSGGFVNMTKEKIVYPDNYNNAATLISSDHVINTMY